MNKKFLFLFSLLALYPSLCSAQDKGFKFPTKADYPSVAKSGRTLESFIPKGWTVLSQAKGDLNNDKLADMAVVLKAQKAKYIQANSDMGVQTFDTNPRMLVVLFKTSTGYKLAELNKDIIPIADGPTMDEPFKSVAIKKGALELSNCVFFNAGSWFSSDSKYKFRYTGQRFELIGAELCEVQRNSGEQRELSYNFLSNKLKVSSSNISDDEKAIVKWFNLPRRPYRAMSAFHKLYEWNVLKEFKL